MEINLPNMSINNIQTQQNVAQAPELKVVANGSVQKKTPMQKIAAAFIAEDVVNIKDYLIFKVLVPTIKGSIINSISLLFTGRPSNFMGGGFGPITTNNSVESVPFSGGQINRIPYSNMYATPNNGYSVMNGKDALSYNEVVCDTAEGAMSVLKYLVEYAMQNNLRFIPISYTYKVANVNDILPYTYNDWGWRVEDVQRARPEQLLNGKWRLGLPKPINFKLNNI